MFARRWDDPKFVNKNVAQILKNILQQYGLMIHEDGITYVADHIQSNQEIAQSALDHVYSSANMQNIHVRRLPNSSSDHVPVLVSFSTNVTSNECIEGNG